MLYYLDKSNRRALRPLRGTSLAALGWSEKDLENLVAEHIGRFVTESQLFVIAQEARGQAAPDIMALDAKGNLHIFELKRWEGNPEALLQVLRYGQTFGQYDYSELNAIFLRHRRRVGVPEALGDLQDEHCRHFELQNPLARQDFNRDQHFVVMTNGLDRATRQAIAYWGRKKIDVRPLLYRVYETAGRDLLLEIDPYGPEVDACEDDASDGLVVVNTNSTYMPDAWRDMLRMSKASAFYERKSSLDGIVKGTPIALYHTGVGLIAIGRATSDPRDTSVGDDDGEERFVQCEFEVAVDPEKSPERAVKAWEINEHLQASHRFRQTVYTLPSEAIPFIRKRFAENGVTANQR